ncbi:MAG: hypothetical protein KDK70_04190 [Myxococcales bacterium]|nr:hypothetical protein [Myxococcales bacterium]
MGLAACRPDASLDAAATTSTDDSGDTSPLTDGSTSTGEDPPPAELCDDTCTPLLLPTWEYVGPSGSLAVLELLLDADGSLLLGLQRTDGELALLRLSATGDLLWAVAPSLPCAPCELEDLALHPSGDIIISATSPQQLDASTGSIEPSEAILARFDVASDQLAWAQRSPLRVGPEAQPRAGEVAVLDEDRIIHAILDGNSNGESLALRDFEADGTLRDSEVVLAQPGTGEGWSPLLTTSPTGELLLAHEFWDPGEELFTGSSWRLAPPSYEIISGVGFPVPLDELAVDAAGRRVELSHSRASQSVTLLLTNRRSSDPERWSASLPIVSTSEARPSLALGPDGDIYVAARATPRVDPSDPYVVMLEVARWSSQGRLRWHAQRSLDMMATADPVELLVDADEGLVVGTVVLGRLHVVRYEQTCACD